MIMIFRGIKTLKTEWSVKMARLIEETDYFTLHFLSDGVYGAIAKHGQGAWSNAGIVDLGDECLVFDSFSTPSAGADLRRVAETITGKKVKYLINSHYHGDHVFGNQAFIDATIISTSMTKDLFKEKNKIGNLAKETKETKDYLNQLKIQMEKSQSEVVKASFVNQFNEMSKVLEDLPIMKLVFPTLLFEDKLVIEGSKRRIELYCFGGGHTPSDTFMYLPEEKIAFMGDLVTENLHLPIVNPLEFKSILDKVRLMDIGTFVPGHGIVGKVDLLESVYDYISYLMEKSNEALQSNQSLETFLSEFQTPEPYSKWRGMNGIKDNLSKVYKFLDR
ncbi:MBL fold metallo-hydrolase [Bacillus sp. 31A1R]|uniref:MBL fold metallo-hydrolase n=1 Tax=Robertmurraya mangrovi TaxID=3098077 RepID=A0ABU5J0K4_9BACI|nr:MBL fold metallo-hydrolase [Bacillus sp. 31A1R]MDZ5472882.1 MBL fold metallo-hydrolase [Bacillus sp. 31A1R]